MRTKNKFSDMNIDDLTYFINNTKDLDLLEQAEQEYVNKVFIDMYDSDLDINHDEIIEEINATWRQG
jgi:hypothetical protein